MQIENDHREHTKAGQPAWLEPIAMLWAMIMSILELLQYQQRAKRIRKTDVFLPCWRDAWVELRAAEWARERLRAAGTIAILNGQLFDAANWHCRDPIPDTYGTCPRTPWDMNRRVASIVRWGLDPQADLIRHVKRLVKRPALRAEEETRQLLSASDAPHRERRRARSCTREGGSNRRILRPAAARAPPQSPLACRQPPTASRAHRAARTPPHVRKQKAPEGEAFRGSAFVA